MVSSLALEVVLDYYRVPGGVWENGSSLALAFALDYYRVSGGVWENGS